MSSTTARPAARRASRRDALRLAAVGTAGGAVALMGGPASAAPGGASSPAPGGMPAAASSAPSSPAARAAASAAPIAAGSTAYVAVQAATLWVEPETFRPEVDTPSLGNPTDLEAWNRNMPDTEPRRWLTGKLETQSVLGGEVLVDEVRGDWAHVVVTAQPTTRDPRGYPGWVPVVQLAADDAYGELLASAPSATLTANRTLLTATPSGQHPVMEVSFDTVLPVLGRTAHSVEVAVPGHGAAHLPAKDVVVREQGETPPTPTVEDLIATGERFLGLRYLWAGVSAYGFDCSGFTYTICRHHGITIARDAGDQMTDSGLAVVERKDLRRGDLVFFATEPGGDSIRHVAMYVGDGQIMQAPNASRSVEIMSLEEYDPDGEYAGARRIIAG